MSRALLVAGVLMAMAGCGSPAASDPVVSPAPTGAASPSATPFAGAAPNELRGDWRTTDGDQVVLTLQRTAYIIHRGGMFGRGNIEVTGDEIAFSGSDLCEGSGTYTWVISDGVLTFTPADDDPCGGRVEVLVDRHYEPL